MTMEYAPITTLICDDLAIGWQTGNDLSVTVAPIAASANFVRSWNGRAKILTAPEFELFSVRISASGDVRPPALADFFAGKTFDLVPVDWPAEVIPTGGWMRTLRRNPYPGSIRVLTLGFEDVAFGLDGRNVMIDERDEPVRIYYRPMLTLFVTEPWTSTYRENSQEVTWELVAEELEPPNADA